MKKPNNYIFNFWKMHPKKKSSRMWVAYKRQKLNEVKGVYLGQQKKNH